MNDETQKELMAFMEGELSGLRANRLATRLQNERGLREAWESQYRISFLLQNDREGSLLASAGFADKVARAIAGEPNILAPQSAQRRGVVGGFWIKAGSVAAVLMVSVSLVSFLSDHPVSTPSSIAGDASGHYAQTAMLRGFSPRGEVFHLHSVADFMPPSGGMDVLIQRDIQRLWIPGGGNYLAASSQASSPGYPGQAGLENTAATSMAGISTGSIAFPAGNP